MNASSRLIVLIVTLLLCQCLTEIECRRTTSTGRRGSSSSRRNNYGNTSQGSGSGRQGGFLSFFGLNKKQASPGFSSSSTSKKINSGWMTASQAGKTSGQQSPSWANPSYKPSAPKEGTGTYGWTSSNKNTNQFQRAGQPSSNIGPGGYPVQSGYPQSNTAGRMPQPAHGFQTASQSHGYNSAPQPHGFNTAPNAGGYHPPPQTHGFSSAQQPHGYSPQSGFNTGYHPPPSYGQPSYTGNSFGGYNPSSNFGHQGFASSHGISPSYYPSQNSFGYPGQGLLGGSHSPKYGGLSLFGGGTGNFGYGNNHWGVPSYGSKRSSGTGKLLTGLAVGAGAGYLTSSLVNRISNPWGYSGWGYGSKFGYDRPIIIKEIRETTKTETPAPNKEPDPRDELIHCVAFDPATNVTLINPNCSCTVTTVIDPVTNLPISTHNCTTANGQALPVIPMGNSPPSMEQLPPNAVNNPNASPAYGGLYNDNMRYGGVYNMGPGQPESVTEQKMLVNAEVAKTSTQLPTTTEQDAASTAKLDGPTTDTASAMMNDSPGSSPGKVKEFYSQLEQIVSMGKFH